VHAITIHLLRAMMLAAYTQTPVKIAVALAQFPDAWIRYPATSTQQLTAMTEAVLENRVAPTQQLQIIIRPLDVTMEVVSSV